MLNKHFDELANISLSVSLGRSYYSHFANETLVDELPALKLIYLSAQLIYIFHSPYI